MELRANIEEARKLGSELVRMGDHFGKEMGGRLEGLRLRATALVGNARQRIRIPLGAARQRLTPRLRERFERARTDLRARLRGTLDVPARSDLDRLGSQVDALRQRLEKLGRERVNGKSKRK